VVGRNIPDMAGLKGKRVGVAKGTGGEIFWNRVVDKLKLNAADYKIVDIEAPEMVAAIERGDIDAFATWEPWPTRALMNVKGTKILQDAEGIYNNINFVYMNRTWIEKNEDTAVRFIRGLREEFGSLYLAAAAYNGGPGRVSRGLARYADDLEGTPGDDAFFVLAEKDYLRNETREYVPQLIAAALIAKEPTRYGMSLHSLPPFAYDSVSVKGGTPIAAIAKAAHASTHDLLDLNPQLLRGMTPPRETFQVRVPVGAAASFDSAFATLSEDELKTTTGVETKKGQTAAGLAEAHGISVAVLKAFNPNMERLKSGRLAPGQYLVFPTRAVAEASLDIPDPSIEKFPHSALSTTW